MVDLMSLDPNVCLTRAFVGSVSRAFQRFFRPRPVFCGRNHFYFQIATPKLANRKKEGRDALTSGPSRVPVSANKDGTPIGRH
jgi:hypothetical protein